jgi:Ribbon-helix-helix domain
MLMHGPISPAKFTSYPAATTRTTGLPSLHAGIRKHSVTIAGQRTSVSLEDGYWDALKEIAEDWDMLLCDIVAALDKGAMSAPICHRLFACSCLNSSACAEKLTVVCRHCNHN